MRNRKLPHLEFAKIENFDPRFEFSVTPLFVIACFLIRKGLNFRTAMHMQSIFERHN